MGNISSIYRNFFHCIKNIQNNTVCFWRKLLPSTGETAIHNTELTKEHLKKFPRERRKKYQYNGNYS